MILIDALFINKDGGAVLLQYLIEKILAHPQKDNFFSLRARGKNSSDTLC
jgi:hypothetical protein